MMLSQVEGTMEKVTCDWATATEADKKQFPDFVAYHQRRGWTRRNFSTVCASLGLGRVAEMF
jgi:hypothetical protein